MSCIKCDEAQKLIPDTDRLRVHTYIRVGKANVLIAGCEEHLIELITKFRNV